MKKLFILCTFFTSCTFKNHSEEKEAARYEILKEILSPDKKIKALIIHEISALSKDSDIVLILRSSHELNEDDFILANMTCLGCRDLEIVWNNNHQLSISYCYGSLSFRNDREINESDFQRNIFVSLKENVCDR